MTALLDPEHQPGDGLPGTRFQSPSGLVREDLFTCVHEQFMTETALRRHRPAGDDVPRARRFLYGGRHTFFQVTKAVIEPPGTREKNHSVHLEPGAARRRPPSRLRGWVPGDHGRDEVQALRHVGRRDQLAGGQDFHLGFETSMRFLDGFVPAGPKFRFKPDWAASRGKGNAEAARPFRRDRNATSDKPFRHGRSTGADVPQLTFTEDAEQPEARGETDGDDES